MVDIVRPVYGEAWASVGEKVSPALTKIQGGWIQEMMPYQWENFLQNRQDTALLYMLQKGVPEWDASQEYIAGKSVVTYQSNLYISVLDSTNVLPTVQASWKKLNPSTSSSGLVTIAGGGTGANTAADARTNLGLGTIATATAPTTNGFVVRTAADALVSRSVTGTANNIVVTNGDGVAGNISINAGSNVALLNTDSSWTSTGSIRLPSGSTSQQGTSTPGRVRFNLETDEFHGAYSDGWKVLARPASAEQTPIADVGNFYTSQNVEGALQEVGLKASFVKDAILSYPDYAAASAAAATLPDGQIVDALDVQERYEVTGGALVFVAQLLAVFRTRTDFVAAVASGKLGALAEGSLVWAGELSYAASAGASVLPGLPGFIHSGVLDGRHHGMVCDGVADEVAAFQSFAAHVAQLWNAGETLAQLRGKIRFNSPVNLKQNQTTTARRLVINVAGVEFICGFNRVGSEAMITIGDDADPSKYNAQISWTGRYRYGMRFGITRPPVFMRCIGLAQSNIDDPLGSSWPNTTFEWWGPQNCSASNPIIYSGGFCFGFKDASSSAFRRTGTTLNRVSGTFEFDSTCVGKTIGISPLSNNLTSKILAVLSPTSVQLEAHASATDTTDREIRFGSPAVFTTAGSNVIRLDGPVSADMVGLLVAIPMAGANGKILIARITGANSSNGYVTLTRPASVTLNPTVSPLSQTTEIACPAVAILSELASEGGYYSNGISQFRFLNYQNETFRGLSLLCDDVESLTITSWKAHGVQTDYRWDVHSIGDIWGNRVSGSFIGESDARRYGQARFRFADQTLPFNFISLTARIDVGEKLLQVGLMSSGFEGAAITFDYVALSGGSGGHFSGLVTDANTLNPGYYPPLRLFRPDKDETYFYLTNTFYVRPDGTMSAGNGALTYVPSTGALSVGNGFKLLAQAPVLRIQDVDQSGNADIAFQSFSGANTMARIRTNMVNGRMSFMVGEVVKGFAMTARGSDATNIPIFESSGAAKAGGLVNDDVYRTAAGDLKVVV